MIFSCVQLVLSACNFKNQQFTVLQVLVREMLLIPFQVLVPVPALLLHLIPGSMERKAGIEKKEKNTWQEQNTVLYNANLSSVDVSVLKHDLK